MFSLVLAVQSGGSAGLTFRRVLHDIPHDVPAVIVYVLLVGFVYLTWRGSRPRKGT